MIHTVFLDLANEVARASTTGTALPSIGLKLRTDQILAFAFMTDGVVAEVEGWVSGKVVIKDTPTSDVLLLDTTLDVSGSGEDTRYTAAWTSATLDGPNDGALLTFLGDSTDPVECHAEIQWTDDNGTHAVAFTISLIPSYNAPADEAPDPAADASWAWLKDRLAAGSNITLTPNETTKVLTIAASASGGSWGGIIGTLADQTDLQAALDAKEPTITAGTTSQFWRGDKSWQTLDAGAVGLGNVENTALSTWAGSTNVTALGTIVSGTWNGSAIADAYIASAAAWDAKLDASAADFWHAPVITVSADAALAKGRQYLVADGTFTLTLPASPAVGDSIVLIQDADLPSGTLTVARNGQLIAGGTSDLSFASPGVALAKGGVFRLIFVGSATGWRYERFPTYNFMAASFYSSALPVPVGNISSTAAGSILGTSGFPGFYRATEWSLGAGLSLAGTTLNVAPAESTVSFTDITTGNASTSKHGYLPKLNGSSSYFLNGAGSWSAIDLSGYQTLTGVLALGGFSGITGAIAPGNVTGTAAVLGGANTFTGANTFASGTIATNQPAINITQTWDGVGVGFKSIFANITTVNADYGNTALMEFQRNNTTVFRMDHSGSMFWSGVGMYWDTNNFKVQLPASGFFSLNDDVRISRDATGIANFRVGTSPQILRASNTYTSTSDFEAGVLDWQTTANTLRMGSDVGSGGGTARDVQLIRGGTVKVTLGASTTDHAQPVKLPSYTVSGLPSAATVGAGALACVTDATATTAYTTVSGGGVNFVEVISDGTNWIIH